MNTDQTELGTELASQVAAAEVVVFRSRVTDTRRLQQRLGTSSLQVALVDMPMGEEAERERFRRLANTTGRHQLPIVFARGRFIGGEPELLDWLDREERAPNPSPLRNVLGYGGLLPFVGISAWIVFAHLTGHTPPITLLLAYGAVILSFVGALHWGWAIARPDGRKTTVQLAWSVIPALLGWAAFMLSPGHGLLLQAGGFIAARFIDATLYPEPARLAAFLRLRTRLTAVAVACLLFCSFIAG